MSELRKLPYSTDAEEAVLGCIINNIDKLLFVGDVLDIEDFYWEKNKLIFKIIKKLYEKNINVDLITLLEEIKASGDVEVCGGISYITKLSVDGAFNNNINDYIRIIKDKANRRKLINVGKEIVLKSYEECEVNEVINEAEDLLHKISNNKNLENIEPVKVVLKEALNKIKETCTLEDDILGNSTGFLEIDETISGLQKGDFIVIAARPSMGKTAFALNIGQYASKKASVLIFSIEMTKKQLMERLLSSKCLIQFNNIKNGNLNDEEISKLVLSTNDLENRKVFIDDKTTNLLEMKAKCRYLKIKEGLDIVIIDYLQLVEGMEKSYSREQEIAKISRELKKLAKNLDVTVIVLSQLSRAAEQRNDHRPILSDLRESGSIEQDADIIMMLYRDEYYNKNSKDKNIAEIIIGKNRNGEVRTVKLGWIGKYQRFAPLVRRS
ncbi:replicative DNA helicase [Clostridium cibarium]|uniref:Replicative DNA helicase n=1 Tax=Clostridium cibarium TaxID=2762247 RepID=A0ABR8PV29_9CLOT|nr:replicative DNA helicase [Clostridium cibarium]MBD7912019.1 replicative DNA helicase [Clostridium cibarium]